MMSHIKDRGVERREAVAIELDRKLEIRVESSKEKRTLLIMTRAKHHWLVGGPGNKISFVDRRDRRRRRH